MDRYSPEELKNINALLIEKVNSTKQYLVSNKTAPLSTKELFIKVQQSYAAVNSSYPFLNYQHQSLKPSLWGWLGN